MAHQDELLDKMSPGTKEEPVSQEELKAVRQIAKRLQTINAGEETSPQRISVIRGDQSPQNSPVQKRSPSFMRHTIGGNHQFSSFSPTAIYPRSTGFIDFHK